MSDGEYRVEHIPAATNNIHAIAEVAKKLGKVKALQNLLLEAVRRLKTDPFGWGDPVFHKAVGGGIVCHGILRPIVVHFVVYESLHAVVMLEVRLIAEFE